MKSLPNKSKFSRINLTTSLSPRVTDLIKADCAISGAKPAAKVRMIVEAHYAPKTLSALAK